jgi:hypothetical protein
MILANTWCSRRPHIIVDITTVTSRRHSSRRSSLRSTNPQMISMSPERTIVNSTSWNTSYHANSMPCSMTSGVTGTFTTPHWNIPPPNEYKLVDIDISSNRVVDKASFCNARPFLNDLVSMFAGLHPNLDFQLVWFIRKREDGDGFQSWHKYLINNAKTAITIVVNIGSYPLESDTDKSASIGSSTNSIAAESDSVNALYFQSLDNNRNLDLARNFYQKCRKIRDDVGLTMPPLDIALQLDLMTRSLYNPCRGQYQHESVSTKISVLTCHLLYLVNGTQCTACT